MPTSGWSIHLSGTGLILKNLLEHQIKVIKGFKTKQLTVTKEI